MGLDGKVAFVTGAARRQAEAAGFGSPRRGPTSLPSAVASGSSGDSTSSRLA